MFRWYAPLPIKVKGQDEEYYEKAPQKHPLIIPLISFGISRHNKWLNKVNNIVK